MAIVTARGGSKGLPGKNIKNINGRPLIGWTLKQAVESQYIDELFVSTDSEEIANDHPEKDGVISVGEIHGEHPMIVKAINSNGVVVPYIEKGREVYQRQQFDKAYFPYGVGYLIKTSKLKEEHTIYTNNMLPYYIERWQNYEIDDIYDFVCIENIMRMESDKI